MDIPDPLLRIALVAVKEAMGHNKEKNGVGGVFIYRDAEGNEYRVVSGRRVKSDHPDEDLLTGYNGGATNPGYL